MKLCELFTNTDDTYKDTEITSVSIDSRSLKKGSLFVALSGTKVNGADYILDAAKNGAAAVVCEDSFVNLPEINIPVIRVKNARRELSLIASKFYGEPSKKLKMIAVTGTNGKTTTTYIIKSILDSAGKKTGLIGTNLIAFGNKKKKANLTTPDPIELHSVLKEMLDAGIEYVIMEASAHALYFDKLAGIKFKAAAFTNFTQDHLDFFENMDSYFDAKKLLFTKQQCEFAVYNIDDTAGITLAKNSEVPYCTYGYNNPSDVFGIDLDISVDGIKYILNLFDDIAKVKFNLSGKFNMYNTLCAAAVANRLGIPIKQITEGIRKLKKVDGRFNIITTSKCSIIIDFAHTDDGLKNILSAVKEFAKKRIITVFGCGGERDIEKRPLMGKTAAQYSDTVIVTSDNPRSENPDKIIADIMSKLMPLELEKTIAQPDRKSAINMAIDLAEANDIIVIAGKGAENYQEVMGVKTPYNDEEYVMTLLKEKRI